MRFHALLERSFSGSLDAGLRLGLERIPTGFALMNDNMNSKITIY